MAAVFTWNYICAN